jgi:uncharacterized tellurite resistance protein B-like protein
MENLSTYKIGLLHLIYLITICDNEIDETEVAYFGQLLRDEEIDEMLFQNFKESINNKSQHDIFYEGITLIKQFGDEMRIRAFKALFAMAKSDSKLHVQEAKFLLYTSKKLNVSISDFLNDSSILKP